MKTKVLSLIALFVLGAVSVFAVNKTEKIEINGNYGICESRIDKAVKGVDGVSPSGLNRLARIINNKSKMPAASHVYKKNMNKKTFDPYWCHTFFGTPTFQ